jgi:hypothetical protein
MREPKFSDAPCYGKDFNPRSRICGVCLANRLCEAKSTRHRQKLILASSATARGAARLAARAAVLAALLFSLGRCAARATQADQPPFLSAADTNSFPDVNQVLGGRGFANKFDRDVFFLQRIRTNYPAYWPALLSANIVVKDYVEAPDKLLRFIEELGAAVSGTDDLAASTNLAAIASDPGFYANTNGYHPEILRAAASTLIKIGPIGRQELAAAFTQGHYRNDPESLEELAGVIGQAAVPDPKLAAALADTAFTFTVTNGGFYPKCTTTAARNLLKLQDGTSHVRPHLSAKEVLADPGRFEAVIGGIDAAHAVQLRTNLVELADAVVAKLKTLPGSGGPYRDDLLALQLRLRQAVEQSQKPGQN